MRRPFRSGRQGRPFGPGLLQPAPVIGRVTHGQIGSFGVIRSSFQEHRRGSYPGADSASWPQWGGPPPSTWRRGCRSRQRRSIDQASRLSRLRAPHREIPEGPADLTPEWLTAALNHGGSAAQVIEGRWEHVGQDYGFTGLVGRIHLRYESDGHGWPTSCIAKLPLARDDNDNASAYRKRHERDPLLAWIVTTAADAKPGSIESSPSLALPGSTTKPPTTQTGA